MSPVWPLVPAAALALLQGSAGDQVNLNTLLLGLLLALGTWTVRAVHQLSVSHGQQEVIISGKDGNGGHEGDIRRLEVDRDVHGRDIREIQVEVEALKGAVRDIQKVLRMKKRRTKRALASVEEIAG